MRTYADALAKLGKRSQMKLANNTYLSRIPDTDTLAVILHGTAVVHMHPDGTYTLNSGGYRTSTTKDRINTYGPCHVITQTKGKWYVGPFPFSDGMRVDSAGRVISPPAPDLDGYEPAARRMLSARVRAAAGAGPRTPVVTVDGTTPPRVSAHAQLARFGHPVPPSGVTDFGVTVGREWLRAALMFTDTTPPEVVTDYAEENANV